MTAGLPVASISLNVSAETVTFALLRSAPPLTLIDLRGPHHGRQHSLSTPPSPLLVCRLLVCSLGGALAVNVVLTSPLVNGVEAFVGRQVIGVIRAALIDQQVSTDL